MHITHWYYIFMCAHLGMHTSVIFSRIKAKRAERTGKADTENGTRAGKIIFRAVVALVCVHGVYAFIVRGIAKYMFFRQPFFFLDLGRGYLLFAVDYISILVLVATAAHWLGKALRARDGGRKA